MLSLNDKVEQFASFAVLEDQEANVVPLPDFVQLDDVRVVEDFEDVDFVDESSVVLYLLLLNGLDRELLTTLSVLRQVDDAKAAIGKLLLERVHLLDVALRGVNEVLRLVGRCRAACS